MPVGFEAATEQGEAVAAGNLGDRVGAIAWSNDDESLRARDLAFERRPQRAGRNDAAVADAAAAVDDEDREILS